METIIVEVNKTELHVVPSTEYEFTVSTKEVAKTYGVTESTLREHKRSSEFKADVHFIDTSFSTPSGSKTKTMWTKRGIVRLGFKLRATKKTIAFRDWAEDFIINGGKQAKTGNPFLDALIATQTQVNTVESKVQVLTQKVDTVVRGSGVVPSVGFKSKSTINRSVSRLALAKMQQVLEQFKVSHEDCTEILESGQIRHYRAYNVKEFKKAQKKVLKNAKGINGTQYLSKYINGKFEIRPK